MKKLLSLLVTVASLNAFAQTKWDYPETPQRPVYDTIWGKVIKDEYRWMEDLKDPKMGSWLKSQSDFTNQRLAEIPGQQQLIGEFKKMDRLKSATIYPIAKAGGKYFYNRRLPGEQVSKLYYRTSMNAPEILLFDPQKYVAGKTFDFSPSVNDDGSKVLLNLSEAGTEKGDLRILDVATKKMISDVIPHSSGQFVNGSKTEIIYIQSKNYDVHDKDVNLNMPAKLHVISTPTSSDLLLASAKANPELGIKPEEYLYVSFLPNSPYMILSVATVSSNLKLFYAPKSEIKSKKINWKKLTVAEDQIRMIFGKGEDLYALTTNGNPNFNIIKTTFAKPDFKNAQIIAKGRENSLIVPDLVGQTKDYIIYTLTTNAITTQSYLYNINTGKTKEVKSSLPGNSYLYPYNYSIKDNSMVLVNSGWNVPFNYYDFDPGKMKYSEGIFSVRNSYPNLENIVSEEIEIPSHDGVMVPLSIVYDKTKLKKDGSNIAFMEGYGAYGMTAYVPSFSGVDLSLLNRGVVLAYAHVRGGGEKGNDWYLAGKKSTKPNTWKDFNACAEYLIKNKYTSPEKFGISGASAGGILIGRAITERPDLYQVAIPKVGCLNSLRTEFSANGPVNVPEFGTQKDETEFKALYEMDAFQHIQKGVKYPAQLITTGFNDPRVSTYEPAKFSAKMQENNTSDNPVLLYVDYNAGHFGGATVDELYAQYAKEFAFLLWQTGHPDFQPKK